MDGVSTAGVICIVKGEQLYNAYIVLHGDQPS